MPEVPAVPEVSELPDVPEVPAPAWAGEVIVHIAYTGSKLQGPVEGPEL